MEKYNLKRKKGNTFMPTSFYLIKWVVEDSHKFSLHDAMQANYVRPLSTKEANDIFMTSFKIDGETLTVKGKANASYISAIRPKSWPD
jgi:hypothetical protein